MNNNRRSKFYRKRYLFLLVIVAFLAIYNIRIWNSKSGNTATLPEATSPKPMTPEQRWKTRVAESGNCILKPDVPTWDDYFDMVEKQESCLEMKMFGGFGNSGKGDGAKNLCMDSVMAPRRNACTVISVGINNEWSFDDAMAAWGCEVFSFDPTTSQKDHQRGERIHFHSLGLSNKKGTISFKKTQVPVDTYRGVLEHVGLTNRTIDYLKIDIEGTESDFFEDVLYHDMDALQHVKQMGVEVHVWGQNVQTRDRLWKIYNRLECLGFKKVYSEKNTFPSLTYVYNKNRPMSCCY